MNPTDNYCTHWGEQHVVDDYKYQRNGKEWICQGCGQRCPSTLVDEVVMDAALK